MNKIIITGKKVDGEDFIQEVDTKIESLTLTGNQLLSVNLSPLWAFAIMLFFELLVFLWSKINFVGSFEWLITNSIRLTTKEASNRLNYTTMMNEIEWSNYEQMLLDSDSNQEIS